MRIEKTGPGAVLLRTSCAEAGTPVLDILRPAPILTMQPALLLASVTAVLAAESSAQTWSSYGCAEW